MSQNVATTEYGGEKRRGRMANLRSQGEQTMGLKPPSLITFMLVVVITVCILVVQFFSAEIPFIKGHEFKALLAAHSLLILSCITRWL